MPVRTVVLLAVSTMFAQGPPPRDAVQRRDPVGTGVIRGRVVAADTGNPIRRGTINLNPVPPLPPPAGPPPPGASTQTTTVMINGAPRTFTTAVAMSIGRPRTTTTDSQGQFEFTALPPGSYRLFATAGPFAAAYLPMAYGSKAPSAPMTGDAGVPIDLADGQHVDNATIRLPRGAVISGRVTDENGDPLTRVQVYTLW